MKSKSIYFFVQENAFENIVCKIPAIMSRPQCVNAAVMLRFVVIFLQDPLALFSDICQGCFTGTTAIVTRALQI